MNLTELLTLWIGEEDTTISLTELEKTYVNAGIRFKIKDLKSKIPDLIEQIDKEIEQCLPTNHTISQYVDRNDIRGLAEYFRATLIDIRLLK